MGHLKALHKHVSVAILKSNRTLTAESIAAATDARSSGVAMHSAHSHTIKHGHEIVSKRNLAGIEQCFQIASADFDKRYHRWHACGFSNRHNDTNHILSSVLNFITWISQLRIFLLGYCGDRISSMTPPPPHSFNYNLTLKRGLSRTYAAAHGENSPCAEQFKINLCEQTGPNKSGCKMLRPLSNQHPALPALYILYRFYQACS